MSQIIKYEVRLISCHSEPFAEFIFEQSEGLEGRLREESPRYLRLVKVWST
jgi:hypothetical protein